MAVTPVGSVDAEKVTGDVVPLVRVAVIDEGRLVEPLATVKLSGEGTDRLKSKALTVIV